MTDAPNLRLLLADSRQALYDATKSGDHAELLHEAKRAFTLMGRVIDEMAPWQDIATAPEGTPILVFVPATGGAWHGVRCGVRIKGAYSSYWIISGTNAGDQAQPTRWMPLPAPPGDGK